MWWTPINATTAWLVCRRAPQDRLTIGCRCCAARPTPWPSNSPGMNCLRRSLTLRCKARLPHPWQALKSVCRHALRPNPRPICTAPSRPSAPKWWAICRSTRRAPTTKPTTLCWTLAAFRFLCWKDSRLASSRRVWTPTANRTMRVNTPSPVRATVNEPVTTTCR